MSDMGLWKLLIDAGILLSCGIFFFSLLRSGKPAASTGHLIELNSKLQSAIREADQTGKILNEQLMRRQEQLEKLLFDVESMESRLNRMIASSDEKKSGLDVEISKAKQIITQLTDETRHSEQMHREVAKDRELLRSFLELSKPVESFAASAFTGAPESRRPEESPAAPAFAPEPEEAAPAWSDLNIFGSKLGEAPAEPEPVKEAAPQEIEYVPLAQNIEKRVDEPVVSEAVLEEQIGDVYTAAENMLKAGRGLDHVARETSLPLEEVKLLKRLMEQDVEMAEEREEKAPVEIAVSDDRLGVLGKIKRHMPFF